MMLRKLVGVAAAVAMIGFSASAAWSAAFIPGGSSISAKLGALPLIQVAGDAEDLTKASVTAGPNHGLLVSSSLFSTAGLSVGTTLLTGVALINNLTLTLHNNNASFTASFSTTTGGTGGGGASGTLGNPWGGNLTGSAAASGSASLCGPANGACLGGFSGTVTGNIIIQLAGGFSLPFPLDAIGVGGVRSVSVGGAPILAQAGPWIAGKARVTGITTNVIAIPARGGIIGVAVTLSPATTEDTVNVTTAGGLTTTTTAATPVILQEHTVTFSGSNNLTSSGAGTVTLISASSINTGALGLGVTPAVWRMTYKFVPEPGTVLLLVSGAAGLALIGRRRMKS